jgi:hypothetical protein
MTPLVSIYHPINKWISALSAGLMLLTGLTHAQTSSAASAPASLLVKSGQKVVFMGDSITGMGWGDTGGYVHLVVDGLNTLGVQIVPVPAGVGGNKWTTCWRG